MVLQSLTLRHVNLTRFYITLHYIILECPITNSIIVPFYYDPLDEDNNEELFKLNCEYLTHILSNCGFDMFVDAELIEGTVSEVGDIPYNKLCELYYDDDEVDYEKVFKANGEYDRDIIITVSEDCDISAPYEVILAYNVISAQLNNSV